jgi:hypothetical protein
MRNAAEAHRAEQAHLAKKTVKKTKTD